MTINTNMSSITKKRRVTFSIDPILLKMVEHKRGLISRSKFISNILSKELQGGKKK